MNTDNGQMDYTKRKLLEKMCRSGRYTVSYMARQLGCSPATVGSELRRGYSADAGEARRYLRW